MAFSSQWCLRDFRGKKGTEPRALGARQKDTAWPDFTGAVEAGVEDANELLFAVAGGCFGRAKVELNAPDEMEHPDNPPWQAFGIGDAIAAEAFAEVARLADIQDALGIAAK